MMRLQKWIAELGITSRREADRWIADGRVTVNGQVAELGVQVNPDTDSIAIDGELVKTKKPAPKVYWLFNKPENCITGKKGFENQETIYDLPTLKNIPFSVAPVGRLDYKTKGLLLLTNDGELNHRLTHPKYHVEKSYYALASKKLTSEQLSQLRKGITLEDGPVKKIKVELIKGHKFPNSKGAWYDVTVQEGRNRLVRRLFEYFEIELKQLIRYRIHNVYLPDELKFGEYKQLSSKQIKALKSAVQLGEEENNL